VEILNADLVSIKLDGIELLPWGYKYLTLKGKNSYELEIGLKGDGRISLETEGAVLNVDGKILESFTGSSNRDFKLTDPGEWVTINLEVLSEPVQKRSITVRTVPADDLPIPPLPGTYNCTGTESGINFDAALNELQVGFHEGTPIQVVEALVGALGCELLRAIPKIDVYRIRIPGENQYEKFFALFKESSVVDFAEYNPLLYTCIIPNDTYESYEYGNGLMHCYEAWDITEGTSDTLACLIDSGAMRDHPDLYENIVDGEDFISPIGDGLGGETPGDGVDNNNDGVPDGNVGHGTHCAGIIGARGNNDEGVSGISWFTHIMPLRVFPVDGDSGAMDSSINEAITYAADHDGTVISLSLGSFYPSSAEQAAINYAWNAGTVVVAAAGNSNTSTPFYPASLANVLSVAATNSADKRASWSDYGTWVDVSAPGVEITSSFFYEHTGDPWSVPENQRYATMSGTSMACPQVSGLVTLVASYFPLMTNSEVADQVKYTADNIDAKNPGYEGLLGIGRINAYRALTTPLAADFEIVSLWTDDDNPAYSQGNRDGFLNPGEIIELKPKFRNIGIKAAGNCYVSIQSTNGLIEPLFDKVFIGYADKGAIVQPQYPLVFRIKPSATDGEIAEATFVFEYLNGDPIELPYSFTVRGDQGTVDTVNVDGEGLLHDEVAKGIGQVAALKLTLEGDVNYATLEDVTIHQSGTADSNDLGEVQLWLDINGDDSFSSLYDMRIAYRSYYHTGFRGGFDDINDKENGLPGGAKYEDFLPVYFDLQGDAHFRECVVPTSPGVPRTIFVIIDVLPTATTGHTVQVGIESASDFVMKIPDQVSPLGFPIETEEVPIVGRWLEPKQLTDTPGGSDSMYSWRAETATCPVSGNVYCVFDSNRNGDFDVFLMRSTNNAESFEDPVLLDSSNANEFYPDVQVDSSGAVHVVYYSTKISNNNREIYYVRSTDFGVTFEDPVRLTSASGNSRLPKLAVGPDDSLNVAWHDDHTAPDDYNIYFMKSTDGGDMWGATVQVCDTNPASEEVAIAVGGDGTIHITWEEATNWYSSNVFYSRSPNGTNWTVPFKISNGATNNRGSHSDVAADDNGNVYVVFHVTANPDAEIAFTKSQNSGANWGMPVLLTDNSIPDSRPAIYTRPDGSYVDIVFRRLNAGTWNIFHTLSMDNLETWSDPVQISKSEGGDAREPVVARASNLNI
ncbi:MAG: S8 family serine peptidase, partial [bacterium]